MEHYYVKHPSYDRAKLITRVEEDGKLYAIVEWPNITSRCTFGETTGYIGKIPITEDLKMVRVRTRAERIFTYKMYRIERFFSNLNINNILELWQKAIKSFSRKKKKSKSVTPEFIPKTIPNRNYLADRVREGSIKLNSRR